KQPFSDVNTPPTPICFFGPPFTRDVTNDDVRFGSKADIQDDVNEKRDRLAAVSQRPSETFATLPWISEWPLRHRGSRPAQPVAGRASGRDWSATRRL